MNKIISQTLLPPNGEKSFSPFVSKYKFGIKDSNNSDPAIGVLIESENALNNINDLSSNIFGFYIFWSL